VSTDPEQENTKEIGSAPPVRGDVLRQNKLRPLSSLRPKAGNRDAAVPVEDTGEDLPSDITNTIDIDRAVDSITGREADEVLATEDAVREDVESNIPKHRVRSFFSAWLGTKRGLKWTLLILFIVVIGVVSAPKTRYWILNMAGVRCSLSLNTTDGDTQLALPGVTITDSSVHALTNHAGYVSLQNLKLGAQQVTLSRPGFTTVTEHAVLGWGSNPLGSSSMKDVGQQYTVTVDDYVSGSAISTASVNDSGLQALADKSGKVTLTISSTAGEQPIPITVSALGYATKNVTLSGTNNKAVSVSLVPSQKEVYVANEGGLYNLYSSYIDGSSKQVLLAGTTTETSNIALALSPDGSEAALVSTKDANYDSTGRLLQGITLVSVADGTPLTLDHAEQIQLIGWAGNTIIYEEQTADGASPSYNIISYNFATNSRNQLATSSQFTGVTLAAGTVYYAIPSPASTTDDGFYAIQPNGTSKQTILSQDVWAILRTTYTDFSIQTANGWYSYSIGSSTALQLQSVPSNLISTQFLDNSDGSKSIAVVNNQLHVFTVSSGRDETITNASDATYPLRWLNSTDLVYRVSNGSESSDYVVNVNGGAPKLAASPTNTTSISGD
jgi:hypothetical protein